MSETTKPTAPTIIRITPIVVGRQRGERKTVLVTWLRPARDPRRHATSQVQHRYSPGAPRRRAQGLGLAMSATATLLHYGFGRIGAAYRVLGALIVAAGLESI